MDKDLKYLNAFNLFDSIGSESLKKIEREFGSFEKAWLSSLTSFTRLGLNKNILKEIQTKRNKIDPNKEFERLKKAKIGILTPKDKEYPSLLKEIYDYPRIIYYLGNIDLLSGECLAIVGSRRHSDYGKKAVKEFTKKLVSSGLIIVSGLALGIDSLAQKTTIETKGKTIAVLGSGLNRIYPSFNRQLARDILKKRGLIMSEYPLDSAPLKHHFPCRNRIISGLSFGVLVIEAAKRSGSLITAKQALEQNREVFALPGSIFSKTSEGCHDLIKLGAKLVNEPEDILKELAFLDLKGYKGKN